MKKKPGPPPTGHNISAVLDGWLRKKNFTQTRFARELGICPATVNQWARGVATAPDRRIAAIVSLLGISREEFFQGANTPSEASQQADIDGLHECKALRIKRAVCRRCQASPRGCPGCLLTRYVNLCIETVNGGLTIEAAEKKASALIDGWLADANGRDDERHFMTPGHGGGK